MLSVHSATVFLALGSALSLLLSYIELRLIDFRLALYLHLTLHAILVPLAIILSCGGGRTRSNSTKGPKIIVHMPTFIDTEVIKATGRTEDESNGLKARQKPARRSFEYSPAESEPSIKDPQGRVLGHGPHTTEAWFLYTASLLVFTFILSTTFYPWFFDRGEDLSFFRLGFVDDTSAIVSFRWPEYGMKTNVTLEYKAPGSQQNWIQGPTTTVSAGTDYTGHFELHGLHPETVYEVRLRIPRNVEVLTFPDLTNDEKEGLSSILRLKTRQPQGTPGRIDLFFGSCIRRDFPFPSKGIKGFRTALQTAPENTQLIFLGDTIYADVPYYFGPDFSSYAYHWRRLMAVPESRRLLAKFPSVFVTDDHEILNDWDLGTTAPYPAANLAFYSYGAGGNPSTYGPRDPVKTPGYFTFNIGDAAFFAADTRRHRNDSLKTMLGSQQLSRIKEWLLHANATSTWKLILTSVPISANWKYQRQDTWTCCLDERRELFQFIKRNNIRNVLFLSGDRHIVGVTRFPQTLFPETIEFSVSPINQFTLFDAYREMPDAEGDQRVYSTAMSTVNWGWLSLDSTDPHKPMLEFKLVTDKGIEWTHTVDEVAVKKRKGITADQADKSGEANVFERGTESGESVLNFA